MRKESLTRAILDMLRTANTPVHAKTIFEVLNTNGDVKYKSVSDLMLRLTMEGHLESLGNNVYIIKPKGKMAENLLDVINRFKDIQARLGNVPIYFDRSVKLEEHTDGTNKFLVMRVD